MRAATLATVIAFAASTVTAQYDIQSNPFHLILSTQDDSLNGKGLFACHEGAAIEGLCVGDAPSASSFQFNTSTYSTPGSGGVLTYELVGNNFVISEPMSLSYNPSSNVAVPLFQPGYEFTFVDFDEDKNMYIPAFVDDTVSPPATTGTSKNYYRWYVCDTYVGYSYTTLAWTLGAASPQNPSCKKVDVRRVFV